MFRINLIVIFVFVSVLSYSQGIIFFEGSFKEAKELAKNENKIIFIDCYTSWCGPCKWMVKNVFTDSHIGSFYNKNFVNYKMDMEKGEGKDVRKTYAINGYPTLLFINSEGEVEHRSYGACDTAEFFKIGKKALDRENNFGSLLRKYNSGDKSPDLLAEYAKACVNLNISYDINEYFKTQNDTDLFKDVNLYLLECYITDIHSREFKFFATNYDKFIQLYGSQRIENRLTAIFSKSLWTLTDQKDPKPVPVVINERISSYHFKDSLKIASKIEMQFYSNSKWRDWDFYSVLANKFVDKFGLENLQNYEIDVIIQNVTRNSTNKEVLNNALHWCDYFIGINYKVPENLLSKAIVYNKIGNAVDAKEFANKALAEEQKKEIPQLKEIQKIIKELEQSGEKN